MTSRPVLERNLIPLGEYRKAQFIFYDSETSQLYAIDDYNNPHQYIGIWVGIVLVVPILRQLSHTIFIQDTVFKLVSIILAIIVSLVVSKCFRKKSFENKEITILINVIIKIVISMLLQIGLIASL